MVTIRSGETFFPCEKDSSAVAWESTYWWYIHHTSAYFARKRQQADLLSPRVEVSNCITLQLARCRYHFLLYCHIQCCCLARCALGQHVLRWSTRPICLLLLMQIWHLPAEVYVVASIGNERTPYRHGMIHLFGPQQRKGGSIQRSATLGLT